VLSCRRKESKVARKKQEDGRIFFARFFITKIFSEEKNGFLKKVLVVREQKRIVRGFPPYQSGHTDWRAGEKSVLCSQKISWKSLDDRGSFWLN